MKTRLLPILCLISLAACGSSWTSAPSSATSTDRVQASAMAPEIPLPLPRAAETPVVKPPTKPSATDAIESHLWAWLSRQIESRQLPGAATNAAERRAIDQAAKTEAQLIGSLAMHVKRLIPVTQLEGARDALHYYQQRYGISAEFHPVVVAVAPINDMPQFRKLGGVGKGRIGGVFYSPSRDPIQGPLEREAMRFTFGSPYVVFIDESAVQSATWATTSVLVHELKHYLDYRRDSSLTPTYAEPAALVGLRASLANVTAGWNEERQSPNFAAFVQRAIALVNAPAGGEEALRAAIAKRYFDYFNDEWRSHLPYLLRPAEASAFLEQVRYYKHWLNQSEAQTIEAMSGAPETTASGTLPFPLVERARFYFHILYQAG